jgi:putative transposase
MKSVSLTRGKVVAHQGRNFEIIRVLDLKHVLAANTITGEHKRIPVSSIKNPKDKPIANSSIELVSVPDERWDIAQKRFEIIRPFLMQEMVRTQASVDSRAKGYNISAPTLYRWLRAYDNWPELVSLLPQIKTGGKGKSRLSPELNEVIEEVIVNSYLNKQKKSITRTYRDLQMLCNDKGINPPHLNTLRNKISLLVEKDVRKLRDGKKSASKYDPITASFPGGDFPLEVVQIDHTPLDLIVVDEVYRLPIGRPYLTAAIDIYSRMVIGFYLTLEAPSAMSVGMCLTHALLPKEQWLNELEVSGDWPCWGMIDSLHMDNAQEFRGKVVERACQNYGIRIEFRPVARPQFGGHIERLLGTFSKEVHALPGSTFSNIQERGEYNSDKHSAMTLKETEKWLTTYIVNVYHQKIHSELKTTPFAKYEAGILGTKLTPSRGLPRKITDDRRLRLDFLPYLDRSVQRYGLLVDGIYYYHDCLRHWVLSEESRVSKKKKLFTVRRDPRDISAVYFYDPELEEYFEIPYRDITHPVITLWELKAVRKQLKESGENDFDEKVIFKAFKNMNEIEENAVKKTKSVRRKQQRKKEASRSKLKETESKLGGIESQSGDKPLVDIWDDIMPFDEID